MILAIISALLRLALTALIAYLLLRVGHMLHRVERAGLGLMGGSSFMTIAVILDFEREGTPFDTWAGMFMGLGAVLFLWGYVKRKLAHDHDNALAVKAAEQHFRSKA